MSGAATAAVAVEADQNDDVCANCGISQVDEIKLTDCDGCDLVKYCSDKCKEEHRDQHKEECKERAKKLHDDDLFTQPDGTHLGECPICFLPMPLDPQKKLYRSCCSNFICMGCIVSQLKSNMTVLREGSRCPFCREPAAEEEEEESSRLMERVEANDPVAMRELGRRRYCNEGEYDSAFDYYTKAALLGDIEVHNLLSNLYREGKGVEKDMKKEVYHMETAAIGGHPEARHNLGYYEEENGNIERSVKHLIIAANLGYDLSMKSLWKHYSAGNITKEDLDATLRAHKAAVDATKSSERTFAEQFSRQLM